MSLLGPSFMGMRVVLCHALAEYEWVPRSWGERLFSWPWRPWAVRKPIEKGTRFQVLEDVIYASPRGYELLRQQAKEDAAP